MKPETGEFLEMLKIDAMYMLRLCRDTTMTSMTYQPKSLGEIGVKRAT